jgi:hypothetical protein
MRFSKNHLSMKLALLGLSLLLHACHPRPHSTSMPTTPAAPTSPLTTTMIVKPLRLSMAELDSFDLALSAVNNSSETLDPQLHTAKLLINGKVSLAAMLTFGNGIRGEEWFALPPGKEARIHWNMWNIFEGPGRYELVLDWWGLHDPVVVTITD